MRPNKNLILLHLTIFIWGFTAILGALITIHALPLVWYRMMIAFIALLAYAWFSKTNIKLSLNAFIRLIGIGAIVAVHWLLFFHSIKMSTVGVALVSLSATALFTSFLDPLFNRTKILALDIISAIAIMIGIGLIFHFETRYGYGILLGLGSALMAALFTSINAKQVKNREASVITLYEMLGGFLAISAYLLWNNNYQAFNFILSIHDLSYLLILGVICTAFAFLIGVSVMKELSAYTVVLTTNLEPVYGIILAFFIFGEKEHLTLGFYAGASVILLAVFLYPVIKRRLITD